MAAPPLFRSRQVHIEQEMVIQGCAHQQCNHSMLLKVLLVRALVVCNCQAVTITTSSCVMFERVRSTMAGPAPLWP